MAQEGVFLFIAVLACDVRLRRDFLLRRYAVYGEDGGDLLQELFEGGGRRSVDVQPPVGE